MRRLGKLVFSRAIMLKARVILLPLSHPAAEVLAVARVSNSPSWASHVRVAQCQIDFEHPILDIDETFPADLIEEARGCKIARRKLLQT